MPIRKEDIRIVEENNIDSLSNGKTLSDFAPDEFASLDAVEEYIQEELSIGTYTIFTSERTVNVEPAHKIFDGYSEDNIAHLEQIKQELEAIIGDDLRSVHLEDDPTARDVQANIDGVTLKISPFNYDLRITVFENERETMNVVEGTRATIEQEFELLQYLGYKPRVFHKRRGARGQRIVKLYYTYPSPPLNELREIADNYEQVVGVYSEDSLTYSPLLRNDREEGGFDAVAFTRAGCNDAVDGISLQMEGAPALYEIFEEHAAEFVDEIEDTTDWTAHSIGVVLATEGERNRLAIGLKAPIEYEGTLRAKER